MAVPGQAPENLHEACGAPPPPKAEGGRCMGIPPNGGTGVPRGPPLHRRLRGGDRTANGAGTGIVGAMMGRPWPAMAGLVSLKKFCALQITYKSYKFTNRLTE